MSEHCDKKFIEDFDTETILTAAMDRIDDAIVVNESYPAMEEKRDELQILYDDLLRRNNAIVSRNTRTTKLLRAALTEEECEGSAGMHDLVGVLMAKIIGQRKHLKGDHYYCHHCGTSLELINGVCPVCKEKYV